MKKVLILLTCVLVTMAFMVSCAQPAAQPSASPEAPQQSEESAEVPDQTEAASESAEEPASSDDDTIARIQQNGKLVLLTNATFPPYEYLGADSTVAGADVDIVQMIADELGVELEVIDMDFDGLPTALQAGKGDIVAAGMTITEERAQAIDFSVPYTQTKQVIIVNKDDPQVAGKDDFEGKSIGVQLGTTGDMQVGWLIDDGVDVEIARYKSNMEAAMDLVNGRLDAIVLDELPAKSIAEANNTLTIIEEPFIEEEYAMAVAKGNTALLEVVNKILNGLMANDQVTEIIDTHITSYAEING
ncbi:MAG: transporter substrate-binding domain-containing protein [Christensenellaceae bacterium]|jgi:ABC-type amino acid transport substrate-binding protein